MRYKHPAREYLAAFVQHAGCTLGEVQAKRHQSHVIVVYEGATYQVSHADDFKDDLQDYFERHSYEEIYSEVHTDLWDKMVRERPGTSVEQWIVLLYQEWRLYWHYRHELMDNERWYYLQKEDSWKDLQVLFEVLKQDKYSVSRYAEAIEAVDLVPIVAMAIQKQYDDPEEFLQTCVEHLIDNGEQWLSMDGCWAAVDVPDAHRAWQTYYIYGPSVEYGDLKA